MKKFKTAWIVLGVTLAYTLVLTVCGSNGDDHCYEGCPAGQVMCGNLCVDWLTDADNCGQCDNACGIHADCVNGMCACVAGFSDCYGQCVNLNYDPANCGTCNHPCSAGECCCEGICR